MALRPACEIPDEKGTAMAVPMGTIEKAGGASAGHVDAGVRQSGEIRKLTSLVEISQALSSAINFKAALHRVLEILEKSHDAARSAVALTSDEKVQLQVAAA